SLEASARTSAAVATSALAPTVAPTISTVAAAIVAATIASTTAKRALEARARIAATDSGGITRSEIFTRGACGTRRASLAGEQDRIVFMRMASGFAGSRDRFSLELAFVMIDRVAVLVFPVNVFVTFVVTRGALD